MVTLEHELKNMQAKQADLAALVTTLGPAGQRADRDFREAEHVCAFRQCLPNSFIMRDVNIEPQT